ncbi:MAG: 6-pyruvoyl trahydropterin synthase family protein [Chlamydiales bacterium]
MISITRKLEFDAGHRVMNHESKCATLHGHRYVIEITAEADALDSIGRVIDFSVLKARIGTWIDENWDHNVIIFHEDKETLAALCSIPRKKEPWVAHWNPTAENMAEYLLSVVCPLKLFATGVLVTKVRVWETPNCYADSTLSEGSKTLLHKKVLSELK